MRLARPTAGVFLLSFASLAFAESPGLRAVPLNEARLWQRVEFRVEGVPAAENPFDPDRLALDATFTAPSGRTSSVAGFWFQDFTRTLVDGIERLAPRGTPEWR